MKIQICILEATFSFCQFYNYQTALSTLGIVAVVLVTGTNLIANIHHEVAITDIRKELGSEFDDAELTTLSKLAGDHKSY